jgi:hypothetical protein|tara:strand:+ start:328 stop:609 length:282 start_codon:yes stop_codon:yes gene_type:complete
LNTSEPGTTIDEVAGDSSRLSGRVEKPVNRASSAAGGGFGLFFKQDRYVFHQPDCFQFAMAPTPTTQSRAHPYLSDKTYVVFAMPEASRSGVS